MKLLLLSILICSSFATFQNTDVLVFTQQDFDQNVNEQKTFYLVVEYAHLDSDQTKTISLAAEALKGFIQVAALHNAEVTIPRVSVYSNGQQKEYSGEWEAQELVRFAFDNIREFAFKRVGKVPKKAGEKTPEPQIDESDVVVLTEENFHETVMNSKDAWFVEFYAPWCGHCKKLKPEWAKLGTALKGEIKVAKFDASGEGKVKDEFGVKGFPTIHFFGAGDKIANDTVVYDGARELEAMTSFAKETNKKLKPLYFEHLLNQQQFNDQCLASNGICFILFVPHIYDCDQECRNTYLETYKEAVKPLKSKPLVHFWSQGGDQYDFEEQFQVVGAGYPSLLAISPKKSVYSKMRGSVNQENVSKFIDRLLKGKEQVLRMGSIQQIESIKE